MSGRGFGSLRIVENGTCPSVAYAGKLFVDLGAEVIKVQPPQKLVSAEEKGAEPSSARDGWRQFLDADKKSVGLDLLRAEARHVFLQLLESADVLFHSSRDAELEEWGLATDQLARKFPSLVVVSVTPFGWNSDRRLQPADDLTLQAVGGISIGIGEAGRPPLKLPGNQSAYQAGVAAGIAAFGGLLSGKGSFIDLATADVWASFYTGVEVANSYFGRNKKGRAGHRVHRTPYPRTVLPCKDGFFAIQCTSRRHWQNFLAMVGREDLAEDPLFKDRIAANDQHGDEADAIFEPWFKERTKQEIMDLTLKFRIPGAPVYNVSEVVGHLHLASRGYFVEGEVSGQGVKMPGSFYPRQDSSPREMNPAPRPGEHTSEVLAQLGFSEGDEERLQQAGAI